MQITSSWRSTPHYAIISCARVWVLFATGYLPRGRKSKFFVDFIILEKGESKMKLTAPKQITWWIALIIAILGLLGELGIVSALAGFAFWLALIAFAVVAIATLVKGL